MPRYNTPYDDYRMMSFLNRGGGSSGSGDNLMSEIGQYQDIKDKQANYGTPDVPPVLSASKPLFSGLRGYQPVDAIPPDVDPNTIDPSVLDSMAQGNHIYYKPGKKGTVGIDELKVRQGLLPYVKINEDDDSNQAIREFLTEPDRKKAVDYLEFAPKNKKASITVDDRMMGLFKGTPLENKIEPGMQFKPDEWKTIMDTAKYSYATNREGRLGDTINLQNKLREVALAIANSKLEKVKGETNTDAMIADMMKGFKQKPAPEAKKPAGGKTSGGIAYSVVK